MSEAARDDDPLHALLAALGDDAGRQYEALRARLIDLFRWRGLARADELADTTLDRAARKLAEGTPLTASVAAFVAGIARLVALEAGRAAKREAPLAEDVAAAPVEKPDPATDACLERCLGEQPAAARDVLLRYVAATAGRARIDARRKLADDLGVELNALRVRVHRIRTQVEACLRACLGNVSGSIDMENR